MCPRRWPTSATRRLIVQAKLQAQVILRSNEQYFYLFQAWFIIYLSIFEHSFVSGYSHGRTVSLKYYLFFMRIAHNLHSYIYRCYFIIVRELLLFVCIFIIICEFNFILDYVQLYQVWYPCLTHVSTSPPPIPLSGTYLVLTLCCPAPLPPAEPGISGRSQIAANMPAIWTVNPVWFPL